MENWIARIVATMCALGSIGLFWTFGVFAVVPWRAGRMLVLNSSELQVMGVSLTIGLATAWGALRIYGAADRIENPRVYAATRAILIIASAAAVFGGISWTLARIA